MTTKVILLIAILSFATVKAAAITGKDNDSCFAHCEYGTTPRRTGFIDCEEGAEDACAENVAFVVGGLIERGKYTASVELVTSDRALKDRVISDFPYKVRLPVALWTRNHVHVCGGINKEDPEEDFYEKQCWMYDHCADAWLPADYMELTMPAAGAVGVVTDDDEPWILGGREGEGPNKLLQSSHIWKLNSWMKGPGNV